MVEKHLKKWSTSLAIRRMQIKTTLRFHLTPVRMTKINKTSWQLVLAWMWSKRNTHLLLVGVQTCIATMEISVVVPQEDVNLPQDPPIALLGIYSQRCFILPQRHLLNHVHCCSIHNSQTLKTTYMSLNRRTDKENAVPLHLVLLSY